MSYESTLDGDHVYEVSLKSLFYTVQLVLATNMFGPFFSKAKGHNYEIKKFSRAKSMSCTRTRDGSFIDIPFQNSTTCSLHKHV